MPTFLLNLPVMELILIAAILFCLALLFGMQMKKDKIDLRYLILDDTKKPNIHKLGQVVSLIVSTWGMVYLIEHDKITEAYVALYMGIWAGSTAVDKYLGNKAPPSASLSTTTTTQITGEQNGS